MAVIGSSGKILVLVHYNKTLLALAFMQTLLFDILLKRLKDQTVSLIDVISPY